jgi:hypothetical protein
MLREVLAMILEEVIEALVAEDSLEAWGYLERIREILDTHNFDANLIPEEVRVT